MIEDMRQPEFSDHSECDKCGATFGNDDLTERLNGWFCEDCAEEVRHLEKKVWLAIKKSIRELETKIENENDEYRTLANDELDNLCDLLEQAWSIVNKLT